MPEPDFDKRGGLLPAIAQDVRTGQVLMVAYMNREAWRHTLATGKATYWSTSRNALWVKGETSGHVQHVRELLVDCDADAVLLRAEVVAAPELVYAETSLRATRWVLVVAGDSQVKTPEDLRGKRVATELVGYTRRWFAERNVDVHIEFSWGATEAKVAEGLVDAIVEVTETGSTIRAHGLRIVCETFESVPTLNANRAARTVPRKREKIDELALLLAGALRAEAQVGLKMNVPRDRLQDVIALVPAITAPTVSPLYGTEWFAFESVIAEATVRELIPKLLRAGAVGIIEYPLNKIVG